MLLALWSYAYTVYPFLSVLLLKLKLNILFINCSLEVKTNIRKLLLEIILN